MDCSIQKSFNNSVFNTHEAIEIAGTLSSQQLTAKRPAQLITVSYSFKLMAHTIPQIILHTFNAEKLKVMSLSHKMLREAFVFPKMNTKPIIKKLKKRMRLEILIDAAIHGDILSLLRLFKR